MFEKLLWAVTWGSGDGEGAPLSKYSVKLQVCVHLGLCRVCCPMQRGHHWKQCNRM